MSKLAISDNVSRAFHKFGFKVKKHSPEIMVVAGVIGTVVSAVMACKATTKIDGVLEKAKNDINDIHDNIADAEAGLISKEEYNVEDSKKHLTMVYARTGLDFVKLYGPSVALGALSITSILTGHNILRKRNLALAAAYTAVDTSFKEYRGRVVERFGKELDRELRYNIKAKEVEETVVDENGKEKKVKKTVNMVDPTVYSDYARFFDESCAGWDKDAEYNLMFLKQQQAHANDILKRQGYIFLNDVYDMLGIPRTKAGFVVGWLYSEKDPVGDNFVDFGISDINNAKVRDFVNGYERVVLLDFNVDGNIWELMH